MQSGFTRSKSATSRGSSPSENYLDRPVLPLAILVDQARSGSRTPTASHRIPTPVGVDSAPLPAFRKSRGGLTGLVLLKAVGFRELKPIDWLTALSSVLDRGPVIQPLNLSPVLGGAAEVLTGFVETPTDLRCRDLPRTRSGAVRGAQYGTGRRLEEVGIGEGTWNHTAPPGLHTLIARPDWRHSCAGVDRRGNQMSGAPPLGLRCSIPSSRLVIAAGVFDVPVWRRRAGKTEILTASLRSPPGRVEGQWKGKSGNAGTGECTPRHSNEQSRRCHSPDSTSAITRAVYDVTGKARSIYEPDGRKVRLTGRNRAKGNEFLGLGRVQRQS